MPLPSSGTINLSDVIEEFGIGTNNSVDLITTASTGTVTAPVTGFVVVEVVGAGGGGGGAVTSSITGGGGGSGAYAKELIYINSGETLSYFVGAGGSGGEGPGGPINGAPGEPSYVSSGTKSISTIYVDGGGGGETAVSTDGTGGSAGSAVDANSNIGISYTGNAGFDGFDGGLGATAPETIGGAPAAGGGGDGKLNAGNGTIGFNGAAKFTWYETTKNLRGYLKSANTNVPDFYKNATIPTSGTVELRDFLEGSAVGFSSDDLTCTADVGSTFTGECSTILRVHANGRYDLDGTVIVGGSGSSVTEALNQQWCTANGNGGFEPRRFYVKLEKLSGADNFAAGSSTVNTYIALSPGVSPTWNLYATTTDAFILGDLRISTTSSDTGLVANAVVNFNALAAGLN